MVFRQGELRGFVIHLGLEMPGPDSSANAGSVILESYTKARTPSYCPVACEVTDFCSKLQLKHAPAAKKNYINK